MKLKNILWMALSAVALISCDNYLDVEAPSAYTDDFIYSQKSEINRALNGVYAQALSGDLYGNAYQSTFIYNSDVEMSINSSDAHANDGYARFDCNERGSAIGKFWTAAYRLIEYANKFVRNAEASTFFQEGDAEVMQQVGEAKCLRAMAYHDLVVMFGDVPFKFAPTDEHGADYSSCSRSLGYSEYSYSGFAIYRSLYVLQQVCDSRALFARVCPCPHCSYCSYGRWLFTSS